jgi:hypothetical protein
VTPLQKSQSLSMRKVRAGKQRLAWYLYYRMQRIIARESGKAFIDQLKYGIGYMEVDFETAEPRHVPYKDLRKAEPISEIIKRMYSPEEAT